MVIARRGSRSVHSIIPDQRKWLSCFVCINAGGLAIPGFYIFRGKRFRRNYIEKCETGSTMAMQVKAWMTKFLFSTWISHFLESVSRMDSILPTSRHLLILDGHTSHVTVEVVKVVRGVGLDLVSLPSHTSHTLQPLDVAVFKLFKTYFREYRNYWTSRNIGQKATKETLAHWVSLALRKALNENNITKGFKKTGIYPLDRTVVDKELGPSETFRSEHNTENSSLPEEGRHAEGVHSLSRSGPQQV
jgi:hypothetical protein